MSNIKIKIKTTDIELTNELESYVNQKVSHIEKFLHLTPESEILIDVEVGKIFGEHHKQGKIFRAELNMNYSGKLLRTESVKEDIFVAVDEVCQEMIRIVRKTKERKIGLIRRGGNAIKNMLRFGREE